MQARSGEEQLEEEVGRLRAWANEETKAAKNEREETANKP
jgi:hypothetical protein